MTSDEERVFVHKLRRANRFVFLHPLDRNISKDDLRAILTDNFLKALDAYLKQKSKP